MQVSLQLVIEYTLRRCTGTVAPSIANAAASSAISTIQHCCCYADSVQHAQPAMVTQLIQISLLRHLLLLSPSLQIFRADDAQECQRWVAAVSGVITEAKRACVKQRAAAAAAAAANNSLNASAANGISGGSPAQISRVIEVCQWSNIHHSLLAAVNATGVDCMCTCTRILGLSRQQPTWHAQAKMSFYG
jgi:hypothetical protein